MTKIGIRNIWNFGTVKMSNPIQNAKGIFCSCAAATIRVSPNGDTRLCCKMRGTVGNTNETPLPVIFNSDTAKRIRLQLANNEWPDECKECEITEKSGGSSWRMERNEKERQEWEIKQKKNKIEER